MAKPKLSEKLVETHSLVAEGYLDCANQTIEIEEVGVVALDNLLANFDGKFVKVSVQCKDEKELD